MLLSFHLWCHPQFTPNLLFAPVTILIELNKELFNTCVLQGYSQPYISWATEITVWTRWGKYSVSSLGSDRISSSGWGRARPTATLGDAQAAGSPAQMGSQPHCTYPHHRHYISNTSVHPAGLHQHPATCQHVFSPVRNSWVQSWVLGASIPTLRYGMFCLQWDDGYTYLRADGNKLFIV